MSIKPYERRQRVADLIQHLLALELHKAILDPRLHAAVVTKVQLSPDLRHAKIYYRVLTNDYSLEDIAAAFKKANGFIRHLIATKTELRYVPRLQFIYDQQMSTADRVSSLLEDITPDNLDSTGDIDSTDTLDSTDAIASTDTIDSAGATDSTDTTNSTSTIDSTGAIDKKSHRNDE